MKTDKLINRIQRLLKKSSKDPKLSKLCSTVKDLKKKQKELESKLKGTTGKHSRKRLQHKIDVLKVQRHKGAKLYKELKAQRS